MRVPSPEEAENGLVLIAPCWLLISMYMYERRGYSPCGFLICVYVSWNDGLLM